MNLKTNFFCAASFVLAAIVMSGCASTPKSLAEARNSVAQAERDGVTAKHAPVALEQAREQLREAEKAFDDRKSRRTIDHEANLTTEKAATAVAQGRANKAKADIAAAEAERQRLLLNRLERLADRSARASEKAEEDLRRAEQARLQADAERRAAEDAQRRAEDLARRIAEEEGARAAAERARAEAERQRAADLARRLAEEEAARRAAEAGRAAADAEAQRRLAELDAKKTDRGYVINIPDVLFEFDRYALRERGQQIVQQVVAFMRDYPERNILVEGHTDNVGARGYNQKLSERRADAVASAIVRSGIAASRIVALGYSEDYPVDSNETDSGRAQNRRTEIYISEGGDPVRPRRK